MLSVWVGKCFNLCEVQDKSSRNKILAEGKGRLDIFMEGPGSRTSCSMWLYSPSVFSLIITRSTSLCLKKGTVHCIIKEHNTPK